MLMQFSAFYLIVMVYWDSNLVHANISNKKWTHLVNNCSLKNYKQVYEQEKE